MKRKPRRVFVNLKEHSLKVETYDYRTKEWKENVVIHFKSQPDTELHPDFINALEINVLSDIQEGWLSILLQRN